MRDKENHSAYLQLLPVLFWSSIARTGRAWMSLLVSLDVSVTVADCWVLSASPDGPPIFSLNSEISGWCRNNTSSLNLILCNSPLVGFAQDVSFVDSTKRPAKIFFLEDWTEGLCHFPSHAHLSPWVSAGPRGPVHPLYSGGFPSPQSEVPKMPSFHLSWLCYSILTKGTWSAHFLHLYQSCTPNQGRVLPSLRQGLSVSISECCGRESFSPFQMWLLVGCPRLRGWSHTRVHVCDQCVPVN